MLADFFFTPFIEFMFMRRALAGALALGCGAAPVGVFLMLRRMSLTGDAIAHAILPGAACAYLIAGLSPAAMSLGGLAAGLTVALLAGAASRLVMLREDASLAAFYLISLAGGVALIAWRGDNLDLLHILFGSVLALDDTVLFLLAAIASITLAVLALMFRPLVLECMDPDFLRSVSRLSAASHFIFLALAVLNLVAGFLALGTLLAVGIMIMPAAAARFWARAIGGMIAAALAVAALSAYAGLLMSYHANVPAGPAIILAAGGFYLISLLAGPQNSLAARYFPRRHLEA